jgi:hypothetical protein
MDLTVEQFADFDIFFYYGLGDLEIETKSDILQNLIQPKRSLFYNRSYDSSGIKEYENRPNSFALRISIPYDIVTSLSKRNTIVSAGENGNPDRRIAVSQATIRVENIKFGTNISVLYIPFANFRQTDQVKFSLPNT